MVTACQTFEHKGFKWVAWEFCLDMSPFPVCSLITLLLIFTNPDELLIKAMLPEFEEVMFHWWGKK